jgi:tetratricopeptide (TPR) repeat protein
MKKVILSMQAALLVVVAYAQPSKRTSAFNYLGYGELDNAKTAIDDASQHEATINDAKTWYFRGQIYHAIYQSKEEKYKSLDPQALQKAVESYIKCAELDKKKDYTDDITSRMRIAENQMMNEGIGAYNKQQYGNALSFFDLSYTLSKHPLVAKLDTQAAYNAALVAEKIENWDKAKALWEECIRTGYGKGKSYGALSELYKRLGQTDKSLETLKQGRVKYPDDAQLIIAELNYYLSTGKDKEAEQNLNLAIEKDPSNKNLYFALGTISNNLANPPADKPQPSDADYKTLTDKAEKAYLKALELDANYFDAVYNLGALYFNGAVRVIDAAGGIKDNKLYEIEKNKADNLFKKGLPFLEKAHLLDPNDKGTLSSLKQLYARTGDNAKYEEVSAKLKALK